MYMNQFYRLFPDDEIAQQVVAQLEPPEIAQQVVAQLNEKNIQRIFLVPWGHLIQIITKCKDNRDKALFYVDKTLENNWSRAVLMNFLDTDLFECEGKAITNFALTLPENESDLAQAITKDPYNFDFITLTARYDEKELKDALIYLILGNTAN